jgi:PAS domain S-box-containing protein
MSMTNHDDPDPARAAPAHGAVATAGDVWAVLARLRAAFQHARDAVLFVDATAVIVDANLAALVLTGCDRGEALRLTARDRPAEDAEEAAAYWSELVAAGTADGDAQVVRKDGVPVPVSFRLVTEVQPGLHLLVLRDTSPLTEAVRALNETQVRYRALSELSSDYAYGAMAQPGGLFSLEWVTESFTRDFGYTPREWNKELVHGRPTLTHEDDIPRVMASVRRVLEGGAADVIHRMRRRSGEFRWLRSFFRPMWDEAYEHVIGIVAVSRDITAERESEETRRELLSLLITAHEDERLRISREFHDTIGQQLTAAELFAATLDDPAAGPQSERLLALRRALADAQAATRSVLRSLRPLELGDTDLASALTRLAEETEAHCDVRVVTSLAPVAPGPLHGVDVAVYRIAREAVTNAVKHAQASSISITLSKPPGSTILVVHDDGQGFTPPQDLGESLRLRSFGLMSMEERAASVGGRLSIEAEPGRGTVVRLEVPD